MQEQRYGEESGHAAETTNESFARIKMLSVLLPADLDLQQVVTLELLQLMLWAVTGD